MRTITVDKSTVQGLVYKFTAAKSRFLEGSKELYTFDLEDATREDWAVNRRVDGFLETCALTVTVGVTSNVSPPAPNTLIALASETFEVAGLTTNRAIIDIDFAVDPIDSGSPTFNINGVDFVVPIVFGSIQENDEAILAYPFTGWTVSALQNGFRLTKNTIGAIIDPVFTDDPIDVTGLDVTMTVIERGSASSDEEWTAEQIREHTFPGWTVSGTGAEVIFTKIQTNEDSEAPDLYNGDTGMEGTWTQVFTSVEINDYEQFDNIALSGDKIDMAFPVATIKNSITTLTRQKSRNVKGSYDSLSFIDGTATGRTTTFVPATIMDECKNMTALKSRYVKEGIDPVAYILDDYSSETAAKPAAVTNVTISGDKLTLTYPVADVKTALIAETKQKARTGEKFETLAFMDKTATEKTLTIVPSEILTECKNMTAHKSKFLKADLDPAVYVLDDYTGETTVKPAAVTGVTVTGDKLTLTYPAADIKAALIAQTKQKARTVADFETLAFMDKTAAEKTTTIVPGDILTECKNMTKQKSRFIKEGVDPTVFLLDETESASLPVTTSGITGIAVANNTVTLSYTAADIKAALVALSEQKGRHLSIGGLPLFDEIAYAESTSEIPVTCTLDTTAKAALFTKCMMITARRAKLMENFDNYVMTADDEALFLSYYTTAVKELMSEIAKSGSISMASPITITSTDTITIAGSFLGSSDQAIKNGIDSYLYNRIMGLFYQTLSVDPKIFNDEALGALLSVKKNITAQADSVVLFKELINEGALLVQRALFPLSKRMVTAEYTYGTTITFSFENSYPVSHASVQIIFNLVQNILLNGALAKWFSLAGIEDVSKNEIDTCLNSMSYVISDRLRLFSLFDKLFLDSYSELTSNISRLAVASIPSGTPTSRVLTYTASETIDSAVSLFLFNSIMKKYYLTVSQPDEAGVFDTAGVLEQIRKILTAQSETTNILKELIDDGAMIVQRALFPLSRRLPNDIIYVYGTNITFSFESTDFPIPATAVQVIYNLIKTILINGALSRWYKLSGVDDSENKASLELAVNSISFIISDRLTLFSLYDKLFKDSYAELTSELSRLAVSSIPSGTPTSRTLTYTASETIDSAVSLYLFNNIMKRYYLTVSQPNEAGAFDTSTPLEQIRKVLTAQSEVTNILKDLIDDGAMIVQRVLYPISKRLPNDVIYTNNGTSVTFVFESTDFPIPATAVQVIYNLIKTILVNGSLSRWYKLSKVDDSENKAALELAINSISYIISDRLILFNVFTKLLTDAYTELLSRTAQFVTPDGTTAWKIAYSTSKPLNDLLNHFLYTRIMEQYYLAVSLPEESKTFDSETIMGNIMTLLNAQADAETLLASVLNDCVADIQKALYPLSKHLTGEIYNLTTGIMTFSIEKNEIPISSAAVQIIYKIVESILVNGVLSKWYTMAGISDDKNEAKTTLVENMKYLSFIVEDRLRLLGLFDQYFNEASSEIRNIFLSYSKNLHVTDYSLVGNVASFNFDRAMWDESVLTEATEDLEAGDYSLNFSSNLSLNVNNAIYRYILKEWFRLNNPQEFEISTDYYEKAITNVRKAISIQHQPISRSKSWG